MAWDADIWTGDIRRLLYKRLVAEFGPYNTWTKTTSPGGERDAAFDEFCTAFAVAVGAKSGDAVKQQIDFALPQTEHSNTWNRQTQTAVLNKAAALEAGFIEEKHLPLGVALGAPD
jgi:hypothetical protein